MASKANVASVASVAPNLQKSVLHVQSCFSFLLIRPVDFFFAVLVAVTVQHYTILFLE